MSVSRIVYILFATFCIFLLSIGFFLFATFHLLCYSLHFFATLCPIPPCDSRTQFFALCSFAELTFITLCTSLQRYPHPTPFWWGASRNLGKGSGEFLDPIERAASGPDSLVRLYPADTWRCRVQLPTSPSAGQSGQNARRKFEQRCTRVVYTLDLPAAFL